MEENDYGQVLYRMENEGFDYCFKHYSNFKEIKDEEFHRLRKNYINASEELEEYINKKAEEQYENE